ncbi:MMPL family transporter [Weizmannia acidilactici]|uniref:MMPL family transporter n=1 Tax=Weizmannia acidilactici TaxID=2607726 RepID=UPI00124D9CC8|nr:MMPL family transporter [Weizmannia acidilactici]GER74487.1 transporter [Weizmannia acidilactici]
MKRIVQFRWVVVLLWAAAGILLAWKAPAMDPLVREKGQITVPRGYASSLADEIKSRHDDAGSDTTSVMIVFHGREKLSASDMDHIRNTVGRLESNKKQYAIQNMTTHFNDPSLKSQLVSKDGKTVMVVAQVDAGGKPFKSVRADLQKAVQTPGVEAMMTGNKLINEDVTDSSQAGLKKTETITVIFILVVLVLVYRSVVAPIIPLLTVGISYMISQFIVAILADKFDFPVSNFTQIFLVAVLFGIGTDYCILLLSRFKEELAKGNEVLPAIATTYKSAGKTVLFSGIAVLIGFASIGLASFKLYQSASAVAIGVVVLLCALFSIVPFFMATLKKGLFWPVRGEISHRESKIWERAGLFSLARPFLALAIVALLTVPLSVSYDGKLSFNSLDELGNGYDAVKAFNIISDSFGAGKVMPVEVVLENDESVKSKDYLALIEKISADLDKVKDVAQVQSATRPDGSIMKEIYVKNQAKTLSEGIEKSNNGIGKIKSGLKEASQFLADSKSKFKEATDGIGQLQTGTEKIAASMGDLNTSLSQIENGIRSGSQGAEQLKTGVKKAQDQARELQSGFNQLYEKYQQVETGINQFIEQTGQLPSDIPQQLQTLEASYQAFLKDHPEVKNDPQFQKLQQEMVMLGIGSSSGTIAELYSRIHTMTSTLEMVNEKLGAISTALGQFADGFTPIIQGLNQLQSGINKTADGQNQVIQKIPSIQKGLQGIADGQARLQSGFNTFGTKINQLSDGLDSGAKGLGKIKAGLYDAGSYLNDLSDETTMEQSGIYIPDELLANADYQKALNHYISKDGKMVTFNITLNENPYSNGAMATIDDIGKAVKDAVKGTKLENAHIGIGGVSSINHDLNKMSKADYSRTVTYMMIGVTLALMIFLRSLMMPLYLLASLLLTYYASVGLAELIFVHLLGYPGISWVVPFFGFVILIALGTDYSIFLMERFNEYQDLPVRKGILLSMKNMGTVIISAAIILSGTFAAMMPSGVLSLLQIATLTLTGLLLYAFVILPLFVPVIVKVLGKANWWPFIASKE